MAGMENFCSHAEVSFDLVMDDEMDFVEGTYRLARGEWCVFIFSQGDEREPLVRPSKWNSGVSGIVVRWPRDQPLNQSVVENVLGQALGVQHWLVVKGPDSIMLR